MIYTASLNIPVKKALGKQAMQSNLNKICEQVNLDPETTNMDVVFLGPKDLVGPKATKVSKALENKHPDICVIYVYEKDNEADLINVEYKMKCKKIKAPEISSAFEQFVGAHKVRQGKQQVSSADFEVVPTLSSVKGNPDVNDGYGEFGMPGDDEFPDRSTRVQMPPPMAQPHMDSSPQSGRPMGDIPIGTPMSQAAPQASYESPTQQFTPPPVMQQQTQQFSPPPMQGQSFTPPPMQQQQQFSPPPLRSTQAENLVAGMEPLTMSEPVGFDYDSQQHVMPEITIEPEPIVNPTQAQFEPMFDIPPMNIEVDNPIEPEPLDTSPPVADVFHTVPTTPVPEPVQKVEDAISKVTSYEEWYLLKEHLNHDSIVKSLIAENSEYIGLINMLDVLDKRIETVWRDTALSAEQKFDEIKSIGLERSTLRAKQNSINVEKVISIISTIILSAKRTVDDKISAIDSALYKITTDKIKIADTSYIDKAIKERTKVQFDLLNISRDIVDLYKSIDALITDEIAELDRKLPSANQFVNDMIKPIGTQIFTPVNTASLANKLMKALQENAIVASQLEESVNALIENLFELCEKDEEIIRYQQNMINMLKANRVEDVVITGTLLKSILRLYVGADNSGRSATAITWCGILSRRQNSLLLDLTGRAKFREYGINPMRLDDFLHSRPEQQFLCVESDHILSPDEIQSLITQLKSRLNYYPYVNIILAPEDTNGLDQLSEEALCVHYITNCSTSSVNVMKNVISNHKTPNIARKLITIDPPVSPLMIADSVNVDYSMTKVITIPNMTAIRACSLRHDRPYEFNDVVSLFEEAFR